MVTDIVVLVGHDLRLTARLEREGAPRTCAAFMRILPFRARLLQARWSGEAPWTPLGDRDFGIEAENQTSRPAPGEILLYPAGVSETEILFPYGETRFASRFGELAGNHFLTIMNAREQLDEVGRRVLWNGAQDVVFSSL